MNKYMNYKHFYNPTGFAEKHLLVCDGLGYEGNTNFLIDREYFNNQLVMHVLEGELYVEQYNQKYIVLPRQSIFLDLRHSHKYYFNKKKKSSIIWFHLRGGALESLLREMGQQNKLPFIVEKTEAEEKICEIFEETRKGNGQFEYPLSAKIYSLILYLVEDGIEINKQESNEKSLWKQEVQRYIQMHISNKFELEELANLFNMSKYHFCRKFKEEFEVTLFEYIRNEKIEIAKKMLLSTNDSIAEIAQYLNYCDQGYFTATFKEVIGCTPKNYRKGV